MSCEKYFCFYSDVYLKKINGFVLAFNPNTGNIAEVKDSKTVDRISNSLDVFNSVISTRDIDKAVIDSMLKCNLGYTLKEGHKLFIPNSNFLKIEYNLNILKEAEVRILGSVLTQNIKEINLIFSNFYSEKSIHKRQKIYLESNCNKHNAIRLRNLLEQLIRIESHLVNLVSLNLYVSDMNSYKLIKEVIDKEKVRMKVVFHLPLNFYMLHYDELMNLSVVVHIFELKMLIDHLDCFTNAELNLHFSDFNNYTEATLILDELRINYVMTPYVCSNERSFQQHVFVDKEDIVTAGRELKDILSNGVINKNDFGKIFIDSDLNYGTNFYSKPIGKIDQFNVNEFLLNCFESEYSTWFLTRNKVDVCCNCKYNEMCPPISGYEYLLDRYNLCNILK